jgi:hypothetical protein
MSAPSYRAQTAADPRHARTAFGAMIAVLALAIILALGQSPAASPATVTAAHPPQAVEPERQHAAPLPKVAAARPMPGEFRLAPGNGEPPGIVVPRARATTVQPMPGEFRLGPGNAEPVGITVPLD